MLGLSQVAVVRAVVPTALGPTAWVRVIASVTLATVAGFTVVISPGGLVVREGVLMATLSPAVGADRAVVSAIAPGLTRVLAEVLVAAVLSVARPSPPRAPEP